jgi:hypothetical protein
MKDETLYDYERQAWVVNGRYQDCCHPGDMKCRCYGRRHALVTVDDETMDRMREQAQEPPVG